MQTGKEVKNQWQKKADPYTALEAEAERVKEKEKAGEAVDLPGTEVTRLLCQNISDVSGGTCFLGFSRGKDSVVAWLFLRQYFHTIIPFHCSSVPHLSFVDESLDYYEMFFQTKIMRCLSGETTTAIKNMVFQPPEDEDEIDRLELWGYDNHGIIDVLHAEYGDHIWCAFGISIYDSIDRRIYVKKNQGRNEDRMTFYPCFDWPKKQIIEVIDRFGVALPGDYRLANRSLAGIPGFRHLLRMEETYPQDMEKIEALFPFIRAILARNEFRAEHLKAQDCPTQQQLPGE